MKMYVCSILISTRLLLCVNRKGRKERRATVRDFVQLRTYDTTWTYDIYLDVPFIRVVDDCSQRSIVGSVVECSPATRAARVRFPDDASYFCPGSVMKRRKRKVGFMRVTKSKRWLETGGIDPPTSHMLSERSTIWATSPVYTFPGPD